MEHLSVKLTKIEHRFGAKKIFSIDSLFAYEGDRIGIIGANGQGKSTLLKLIKGEMNPDSGRVQREIDFNFFTQIEEINEWANFEEIDWELVARLSVPKNPASTLSGGEENKYRLAQTLSSYKPGLLLDEPTTHLDRKSIQTLIEELRYYYGTLLFVSHDRHFLNQLATKIWEIDAGEVKEYVGNYEDYCKQKELKNLVNQREAAQYIKEKKRLESAVSKKKEQAERSTKVSTKKSQQNIRPDRLSSSKQKDTVQKNLQKSVTAMESRLAQLEKVERFEKRREIVFPPSKIQVVHNKFPIRGEAFQLERGGKLLIESCDFQFPLGKRIAIVGENGSGKTSLLQSILNNEEGIVVSPKVLFATYHQMSYKMVDSQSLLEFSMKHTSYKEALVRSILHNLGFSQLEMTKPIKDLSGGEATRLQIALLFVKPSNVLILDEPTNFIDLTTVEALERLLLSYQGTVIVTSHDPYFVEKIADEIFEISDFKLKNTQF